MVTHCILYNIYTQYSRELLANIRQAVPFALPEKFEWKTNYAATMPKKNIILISFPVLQHICGQRGCNNNSDNNNNNNGRKTAVKKQTNLHNMSHRETKRTPRVVGGQQNISGFSLSQ